MKGNKKTKEKKEWPKQKGSSNIGKWKKDVEDDKDSSIWVAKQIIYERYSQKKRIKKEKENKQKKWKSNTMSKWEALKSEK